MQRKMITGALVLTTLLSSSAFAGFDINAVVARLDQYDQVDLYFLNKDTGGTYINPFFSTGTDFVGATLFIRLNGEHRAYFNVRRLEFGDKVDFRNTDENPHKGWLRAGTSATTNIIGALPSPLTFPFGTNPYEAGVSSLNVSWGHTDALSGRGVEADAGPGAHAARLIVDSQTTIRIWGVITGTDQFNVEIPESNAFIVSTVPEPSILLSVSMSTLVFSKRRR